MRGIVRAVSNTVLQMEWLVQPERIDPCVLGANLTQGRRLRHQQPEGTRVARNTFDSTRNIDTGAIEVVSCMT